ncbi:MAG: YraN family protein [Candidatus Omnitrophica bacterium]|nr:YraN family protein [Candidatus Omnitrophota bacterium]
MKLTPHPGPFRSTLGERGERAACVFLKEHGYEILEKNYKCKIGEIDVIARRHGRLAFVEIKTRTSAQFGIPQEAVHLRKQEKIFKISQWYMKEKKLAKTPIAFDVVAILWREGEAPEMRLIVDAFEKEDKPY